MHFYFINWAIMLLLRVTSYLLLNESIHRTCQIFTSLEIISALFWFETISTEKLNTPKLVFYSAIAFMALAFAWMEDSIKIRQVNGYTIYNWTGWWEIFGVLSAMTLFLEFMRFLFRIVGKTKPSLRKRVIFSIVINLLFFLMIVIIEPISKYATTTDFNQFILDIIGASISVFVTISVIIIYRTPQFMYILPFRVDRLIIIETPGGIPIYNYFWQEEEDTSDELLLAGLLQAVQHLSFEVFAMGELREIRLEKGILLIHREENITVGLVSTISTSYLRTNLALFTQKFAQEYRDMLQTDLYDFENAEDIIKDYFSEIIFD